MMLSVSSSEKMLHTFESNYSYLDSELLYSSLSSLPALFEFLDDCSSPDCSTPDRSTPDYSTQVEATWGSLLAKIEESSNDSLCGSLLQTIDPSELSKEQPADEDLKPEPYHPFADHSYVRRKDDEQLFRPEEEEDKHIDVWNGEGEPVRPPPEALAQRRNVRRTANAGKSVSIRKAATVALKRTRSQCYEPSRKVKKIKNSVETTPSGSARSSDYEEYVDIVKPKKRAKHTGVRSRSTNISKNANSKGGKSEVQRTNHNRNEKKRREQMSSLMRRVRSLVPLHYFRDCKTEKAKSKASKQKILTACRLYIVEFIIPELIRREEVNAEREQILENIKLLEKFQAKVKRMRASRLRK